MSADVMLREPPTRVREYAPPLVRRIEPPAPRFQPPGRALMTLEEYFAFEEATEARIDFIDGEIFIVSSVDLYHGMIMASVPGFLFTQLSYPKYTMLGGVLPVRPRRMIRFFPGFSIVSGDPLLFEDIGDLANPVLVAEVLSQPTSKHVLYTKLPEYRAMPTMEHILIIEQDRPLVQHHSRVDGEWTQLEYTDMDDIVNLDSMGASMSLAQIYRGVDFPQS